MQLLRFVGIVNAAVWLGAMVFFTFFAGPAFFTEDVVGLLGGSRYHAGAVAQVVLKKYFLLQQWCAGLAIAHLIVEWLYTQRPFHKLMLLVLMLLFAANIVGGQLLLPKMKDLHLRVYATNVSAADQQAAKRSFGILHGTAAVINLLVIGGVLVYLWQATNSPGVARFSSINRFKS